MSTLERYASVVGAILIGLAAFMVSGERKRMEAQSNRPTPPVEELGEKLRQAWAAHHNA